MRCSSETARCRRASYQRSHTVDAFPMQLIHPAPLLSSTDQRNSFDSQDEAGSVSEESRLLGSIEGSPFHAFRDSGPSSRENHLGGRGATRRVLTKNLSFQNVLSENGLSHQRLLSNGGSTRSSKVFLRKSSDNDLLYGCTSSSSRILERSPSSSSALLAKVKDRIVDTFFQTSSEGPQLAAIVQERRQRAAEEYEARLSIYRAQQKLQASRTGSLSSDSGSTERFPSSQNSTRRNRTLIAEASVESSSGDAARFAKSRRDGARAAFRRRSVSEDNCLPLSLLGKSRPVGNGSVAGSQAGLGGVVCSSDDFQALVSGLGHRRGLGLSGSRSRCMGPRAMSFDQTRYIRPGGSPFGEYGPGDGSVSQRLNNSSKILETHEEVADCAPHVDLIERREGDDSASKDSENAGDLARRPSRDSSEDATEAAYRQKPSGNSCGTMEVDCGNESASGHVPPVPEVEFDANGQTWDVYGAELDPEILGNAIQVHLSRLIAVNKAAAAAEEEEEDALNCRPQEQQLQQPSAHVTAGGEAVGTCAPHRTPIPPKDYQVTRQREHADVGCLSRYFCIFSASDET